MWAYRDRNNAIFAAVKYCAIRDIFAFAFNLELPHMLRTINVA